MDFLRRMDQVASPGLPVPQRFRQRDQPLLDARRAKPTGAKEAQHAAARHLDHQRFGGDAARHCAGDVGEAQTVYFEKGALAQPFRV